MPIQTSTSKVVQGMALILVLYADGIFFSGNELLYRKVIEEILESSNANLWTFQLNFKKL